MIETTETIANLDTILAVDGIDVFFLGPGDLSQSMGYLPTVPRGQKRPQPVLDEVAAAIARIRKAGRIAGTLVTEDDIAHDAGLDTGFFCLHSDPFLRTGLEMMRQRAG